MSEFQRPNEPRQPQPMGPTPPSPAPQQPPPVQEVPPDKQKRFRLVLFLPAVLAAAVALLAGIGIGSWRSGERTTAAAPAATVTVTQTIEAPVEDGGAPTVEPTQEPSTEPTEATFNPMPKDFRVGIKILEKQCFGSARCSITFRIVPSYLGSQSFPAEGTTEVTYQVTGGQDPMTNTFEVDGEGTMRFDEEESVDTPSSSTKLVAEVTDVTYNEFG